MNRRSFLLALPVMPAICAAPPPVNLRPVYRWQTDHWRRVRLYDLVVGDHFYFEEKADGTDTVYVATDPPEKLPDGVWSVMGRTRDCDPPHVVEG